MQGSGEKLTIAEFAARANITKQRVYQLLDKTLKDYLIIENGKKYVDFAGLAAFNELREKQGLNKSLTALEQGLNKPLIQFEQDLNKALQTIETLKQTLESTENELQRARSDLEAAREQRQKAEIRAAAADAAADAERKRADAAEKQCAVKDDQAAQQAQTVAALTAALQTAQEQAANLTKALDNSQALQAGQIRLAMQDDAPDIPADQQPKKRRGLFGGLFHRRKKE